MAFFCRALILLAVTVTFHQQVCGQIQGKSCNADQLSKKQDGTFCSCCDLNSTCSFDSMKFELYCKCDKGFNDTGSGLAGDCMDIDECKLDLCDDKDFGGICNNTVGSYSCGCSDGYRFKNGSRNKCVEIDECEENMDNCNRTISTCVNTPGSYECYCHKYHKKNESSGECVDINECSSIDLHTCQYKCVNLEPGFRCECGDGYTGDGNTCKEIDECKENMDNCNRTISTCINTLGSYKCDCHKYYEKNENGECVEIDECEENMDNCNRTISTCVNTAGSYECYCNKYYEKNENGECVDIDECSSIDLHTCKYKCVNLEPGFRCECGDGYTGDGDTCKDIDECGTRVHNCHVNADCSNTNGSFNCTCKNSFYGNGTTCEGDHCYHVNKTATQCIPIDETNKPETELTSTEIGVIAGTGVVLLLVILAVVLIKKLRCTPSRYIKRRSGTNNHSSEQEEDGV